MRKTSHDGGDSTSITSGAENETKKSAMKPKKTSLKRKPANFSHESDDTVIEPLLQKEKTEATQSAKSNTKGKTDTTNHKANDKNKQYMDEAKPSSTTGFCGTTESLLSTKDYDVSKPTIVTAPLHNYMNTNMFHTHDNSKANSTAATKSQMLVEIDGSKQSGYSPSPLIFTTAKIHTDGKSKHMEPVQVTPVPILSTVELGFSKGGGITTSEKKIANGSSVGNSYPNSLSYDKVKDNKVGKSVNLPTSIKDPILDANANSFVKITSSSSVQSSNENNLSSVSTQPMLTTSTIDAKDTKASTSTVEPSPIVITQPLLKSLNTGSLKNNVTVKTQNNQDSSVKLKSEKVQSPSALKTDLTNKRKEADIKSTNNIKSPESKENSQTNISTSSIKVNSKLLQRQKTLTDNTSAVELKNNDKCKDLSAKVPLCAIFSSTSKPIESNVKTIDSKNELQKSSANNIQNIETTSPVSTFANLTSASTKPAPASTLSKTEQPMKISSIKSNGKMASSTIPTTNSTLANPIKDNMIKPDLSTAIDHKSTSKLATDKIVESIQQPVKKISNVATDRIVSTPQQNNKPVNVVKEHSPLTTVTKSISTDSSAVTSKKSDPTNTFISTSTKTLPPTSDKLNISTKPPLDIVTTNGVIDTKQSNSTISNSMIKPPSITTNTKLTSGGVSTKSPTLSSAQGKVNTPANSNSANTATKKPTVGSEKSTASTPSVKSTQAKSEVSANSKASSTESKTPVTLGKTTSTSDAKSTSNTKTTKEPVGKTVVSKTSSSVTKASTPTSGANAKSSNCVTASVPVTTISIAKPAATTNSKSVTSPIPTTSTKPSSSLSSNLVTSETSTKGKTADSTQTNTKQSENKVSSSSSISKNAPEPVNKNGSKSNKSKTDVKISKA